MNYHNEATCFQEITPEVNIDNLFAETAGIEHVPIPFTPLPGTQTNPIVMKEEDYEAHAAPMRYHESNSIK